MLLIAGLVLFLAATALTLALFFGAADWLFWPMIVGFVAAAASFAVHAWRERHRVDPLDLESERRLWRSGPLGRGWLELRRRLREGNGLRRVWVRVRRGIGDRWRRR